MRHIMYGTLAIFVFAFLVAVEAETAQTVSATNGIPADGQCRKGVTCNDQPNEVTKLIDQYGKCYVFRNKCSAYVEYCNYVASNCGPPLLPATDKQCPGGPVCTFNCSFKDNNTQCVKVTSGKTTTICKVKNLCYLDFFNCRFPDKTEIIDKANCDNIKCDRSCDRLHPFVYSPNV